ncbi:MAG: iron ABC transporter permease [Phycisphaerales bacterium]|nr:iron ABC transporter permease [Phycisphaerales bacterium]
MNRRGILTILGLMIICVFVVVLRLMVGSNGFGFSENPVVMQFRFNRIAVGGVVGASLGLAGTLLQSLLRNPLAAPDLMGLSAGAGFAVTLATWMSGVALGAGMASVPAMIGAIAVLSFVWILSQRRGLIDPVSMILIGVIVSVILGAATMLVASMMPDKQYAISRWMMGVLREDIELSIVWISTLVLLIIGSWSILSSSAFDAMALSEDEARSVGVRVGYIRIGQLLGAGILTAMSIVLAGPIGFVGLVSPHIVRVLAGPTHRVLVIGSTLCGFSLVIGADTFVRLVATDAGRIPIGVVTSLIGGPVFLFLLLNQRRRN